MLPAARVVFPWDPIYGHPILGVGSMLLLGQSKEWSGNVWNRACVVVQDRVP